MTDLVHTTSHHDVLVLVVRIAVLLATARLFGEAARRLGQPAVVGEILAGVVLGPSLLGGLVPVVGEWLVPSTPSGVEMLDVVALLGAMFLLILTGLETDIPLVRRHARTAVSTSLGGIAITFTSGYLLASALPDSLLAAPDRRLVFNLFVATAMSVSAIPVVAKVLMDLGLMRRTVGQTILAAGMVDDTVAWTLLSIILGVAAADQASAGTLVFAGTKILLFLLASATVGRWLVVRLLSATQDLGRSPERMLTLVFVLAFAFGAVTQALGIEAVLGAFVVGVILGTVPRLPHQVVDRLESVTIGIFAPLFFATAGLKVNLRAVATPEIAGAAVAVVAVAVIGKYAGTYVGARLLARKDHYSALAFGSGLNARGAVEIIVASIGLSAGILSHTMYSIIVMMAVVTSVMAPFGLRWALARVPMDPEEQERLERERLDAESFLSGVKRVLIPLRLPAEPTAESSAVLAGPKRELLRGLPRGVSVTLMSVVRPADRPRALAYLHDVRTCLGVGADVQVKATVAEDPVDAILGEAQQGYGLIVIGAPSTSDGALFNPDIDKIVRLAPCSVAIAAGGTHAAEWRPAVVLVPTNGSTASRHAAEAAFAIAGAVDDDCRVIALHVAPPPDANLVRAEAWREELGTDIVANLRAVGEARGVEVTPKVRRGDIPSTEILREAEASEVDLIILGTDLRPGARRLHLGRGVETVLTSARCSVLVVNAG